MQRKPHHPDDLLEFDAVADLLDVHQRQLASLIEDDPTFPRPVNHMRRGQWCRRDIDAWLASRGQARQTPKPKAA
jgi:predicted DNA-binding transcriptional regulator AlpA